MITIFASVLSFTVGIIFFVILPDHREKIDVLKEQVAELKERYTRE
jgi:hypothetical protein